MLRCLRYPAALAVALSCFLLGGSAASLSAQIPARNPHTSQADVDAGRQTFRSHCARCHGRSGTGGMGPDLSRGRFRHATSDRALFLTIRNGISQSGMPGFYRGDQDRTVWQLAAFVRSLSRRTAPVQLAGDSAAGETLYRERGGCGTCHILNGTGGRFGPDLSELGWLRSPEHLRASLVRPHDQVAPRWWRVRLTLRDGTTTEGIRLDDDTFSVRILDANENLRSFLKTDLTTIERIEQSSMPSFEDAFALSELEDLIAYLYSLRGGGGDS